MDDGKAPGSAYHLVYRQEMESEGGAKPVRSDNCVIGCGQDGRWDRGTCSGVPLRCLGFRRVVRTGKSNLAALAVTFDKGSDVRQRQCLYRDTSPERGIELLAMRTSLGRDVVVLSAHSVYAS